MVTLRESAFNLTYQTIPSIRAKRGALLSHPSLQLTDFVVSRGIFARWAYFILVFRIFEDASGGSGRQ